LVSGGSVMAGRIFASALYLVIPCLSLAIVSSAHGRSPTQSRSAALIEEASPALAPFQHVRFCLRYPDDCKSDPNDSVLIELTAENSELINRVNRDVNAAIAPMHKGDTIDVADGWTIAPTAGDCNDYAVTKRHDLLQSGLPAKALRLAVVKTPSGIGHLVLVVATTQGDLVLDNLVETIRPWQNTRYQWLKIQSANDARYWFEIRLPVMALAQGDHKLRMADR
jgi:predicted transglutaminase-like cysteine proteinase